MKQSALPGSRWLGWLHIPALRVGVLTGIYLITVMVMAVLVATGVAFLEPYADLRNWVFRALFAGVAAVPLAVFRRSPGQMYAAAVSGWFVFVLGYAVMGLIYPNLFNRIHQTPFQALVLGGALYGVLAVALWFVNMVRAARRQPAIASRRRPY